MKRIAAVTMVRNDEFFLRKWVEYYGGELGKDNLYVFYDGTDQIPGPFCEGTHTELHPRFDRKVVRADKDRLGFLSQKAASLFAQGYDLVIGTDADEYLVVDPSLGIGLADYLSGMPVDSCASGLGLDVGQKLGAEGDLSSSEPFLNQRQYAQLSPRYTKASVISAPCVWGSGFHRVKRKNYHIMKGLYLIHFGYSDQKCLENRLADPDRISQGWGRHIRKRSRTIRYVTDLPARNFDKWTRFAAVCQTLVRQPLAWNKPSMLNLTIVVRLPERFRGRI